MRIGIAGPLAVSDIAHLLDPGSHLPAGEMRGASLLVALIEALLEMGHEVSAFTTEPSLLPNADSVVVATGPRFRVHFVPMRRYGFRWDRMRCGRMLDLFRMERQALVRAMRTDRPDVIHAHWTYEYAWAALDSGLPTIVTCHDAPWTILKLMPNLYRVGRLLMAIKVLRRAEHLTAVSPYLLPELSRLSRRPIDIVENPLPSRLIAGGTARQLPGPAGAPMRVAMVINGWSSRKNAAVGMEALFAARKALPSISIDLIGPDFGPGEAAYSWAQRRGMDHAFHFCGPLPYAEVQRRLSVTDLLVHPALEESFGMTIAEAMALGIPVVAGRTSGAVPWVMGEGTAGLLVDVTSSTEIMQAILTLLQTPELYSRCSVAGRTRALSHFSARSVADRYVTHYEAVRQTATEMAIEPVTGAESAT